MSATTVSPPAVVSAKAESPLPTHAKVPSRIPGPRPTKGIPFTTLLRVEARKMFDTRAGRWLLISVGLLIATVLTIQFFFDDSKPGFQDFLGTVVPMMAYLLPVIGILAITAEFSQRTGLVTYGLEPRRARVTWAKLLVSLGATVVAMVVALALAAVVHQASVTLRGATADWHLDGLVLLGFIGYLVILTSWGVALGMVLRNSAAAIVLFFVVPNVWTFLGFSVPALETPAKWLDMNRTMQPLFEGSLTGEQWAQLGTSVGVWVVLPLAIGMVLLNRAEVK